MDDLLLYMDLYLLKHAYQLVKPLIAFIVLNTHGLYVYACLLARGISDSVVCMFNEIVVAP